MEESGIIQNTTQSMAKRDPVAAMEWVGNIGSETAALVAMNTWSDQDISVGQCEDESKYPETGLRTICAADGFNVDS